MDYLPVGTSCAELSRVWNVPMFNPTVGGYDYKLHEVLK